MTSVFLTPHQRFLNVAALQPESVAVCFGTENWTYRELAQRSTQMGHDLLAEGVRRGDIVGIYCGRCPQLICAMLAVWQVGASFTLLDPHYPDKRLAAYLAVSHVSFILCPKVATYAPREALVTHVASTILSLSVHEGPPLSLVPLPAINQDLAVAYIHFTSGTTGSPQGVIGTFAPLSHFFSWYVQAFQVVKQDRFGMLSSIGHDPLLRDIFVPLWQGASIVIPERGLIGVPGELRKWLREQSISVIHTSPLRAEMMAHVASCEPLTALRLLCVGGDLARGALVPHLQRMAPQAVIANFYGATETPQVVSYYRIEPNAPLQFRHDEPIPIGFAVPDFKLLIANENPAGIGEIVVRSHYLAAGYIGNAQLTRERFRRCEGEPLTGQYEREYYTGDLGYRDAHGALILIGRRDDHVKILGYRIDCGELRQVICTVPGVRDAVVYGAGEENGVEQLACAIVPDDILGSALEQAVRTQLSRQVPSHMVPATFIVLDSFPLTSAGKLDLMALKGVTRTRVTERRAQSFDETVISQLSAIWSEVFASAPLGAEADFFELGGDSALALNLVAKIHQNFHLQASLLLVYDYPQLGEMAKYIASHRLV